VRTEKPRQPREYLERVRALAPGGRLGTRAAVAPADLPFEFMLNALRLNEGFSWRDYEERTGLARGSVQATLERAARRGLVDENPLGWRASELGRRFLNDLQAAFLA
jgi:coproporphyrinogen III oxidase-like Fe-S oxidoreductase